MDKLDLFELVNNADRIATKKFKARSVELIEGGNEIKDKELYLRFKLEEIFCDLTDCVNRIELDVSEFSFSELFTAYVLMGYTFGLVDMVIAQEKVDNEFFHDVVNTVEDIKDSKLKEEMKKILGVK